MKYTAGKDCKSTGPLAKGTKPNAKTTEKAKANKTMTPTMARTRSKKK